MAKLKLKYGRLDSLPPMLSPRTMFASTHILHTLKKENRAKRARIKEIAMQRIDSKSVLGHS